MFDGWFKSLHHKSKVEPESELPVAEITAHTEQRETVMAENVTDDFDSIKLGIGRILLRQPVLNVSQQLIGFDIGLRTDPAVLIDPVMQQLSDETLVSCITQLSVQSATGDRLIFVTMGSAMLSSPWVDMLPSDHLVLAIDATQINSVVNLSEACRKKIEEGYRIAFDNLPDNTAEMAELAGLASYLRFDLRRYSALDLKSQIDALHGHCNAIIVARQVDIEDDYQAARAMGFDAMQGYYFAQVNPKLPHRIDSDRMRVMELLNMTAQHAELFALEQAIKHDVLLSYRLLTYINSPLNALSKKLESIAQALIFLGYDPLYRWLTLLLFAGGEDNTRDHTLLQNALVRARMAELLGKTYLTASDADSLFVVGMFSMLDVLLNMPMDQALEKLNLSDNMVRALLQQRGPYAPYLRLTIGFENADQAAVSALATALAMEPGTLNQIHMDAINWAMSLKS